MKSVDETDRKFNYKDLKNSKIFFPEFADETKVKEIVKKYSSFVGSAISLNGTKSNDLRPGNVTFCLISKC